MKMTDLPELERPNERLIPRDALRGGKVRKMQMLGQRKNI